MYAATSDARRIVNGALASAAPTEASPPWVELEMARLAIPAANPANM